MKYRFVILTVVASLLFTAEITVKASGFENQIGQAIIVLYNSNDDFPTIENAFKAKTLPIGDEIASSFADIPEGVYCIAVYHDENKNGTLDMAWFPIPHPKEGFALSNNATKKYLPPSFRKASFGVKTEDNLVFELKIVY